ncbi:hypothetical protein [Cohnella sp.]|uniref:hypothetical protein n=1 Tax=Cohnella sp. TaxID=1883426 RepID=UPI00356A85DB
MNSRIRGKTIDEMGSGLNYDIWSRINYELYKIGGNSELYQTHTEWFSGSPKGAEGTLPFPIMFGYMSEYRWSYKLKFS